MLQYMLDTNICIYVMQNYPARLAGRFNRLSQQIAISAVTLGELYFGAEKSARRDENLQEVEIFVGRLEVLPFGPTAAAQFGQIRTELERAGSPIGPYDTLIAAHARAERLTVVTHNIREFRRVSGLRVETWS